MVPTFVRFGNQSPVTFCQMREREGINLGSLEANYTEIKNILLRLYVKHFSSADNEQSQSDLDGGTEYTHLIVVSGFCSCLLNQPFYNLETPARASPQKRRRSLQVSFGGTSTT